MECNIQVHAIDDDIKWLVHTGLNRCITKLTLTQMVKQIVILMGAGMMLLEVLLVGATSFYVYVLIFGYTIAYKVYCSECIKTIKSTTTQIRQLRTQNDISEVIAAVVKKRKMLIGFLFILSFQFLFRILIIVAAIFVDKFTVTVASEALNLIMGFLLAVYFRLRDPITVTLALLPSGEFSIIRERMAPVSKEDQVQMVSTILI